METLQFLAIPVNNHHFQIYTISIPKISPKNGKRPESTSIRERLLSALTEVDEPVEMGVSLVTGAHRHRSVSHPGVNYVPMPWALQRIPPNLVVWVLVFDC